MKKVIFMNLDISFFQTIVYETKHLCFYSSDVENRVPCHFFSMCGNEEYSTSVKTGLYCR